MNVLWRNRTCSALALSAMLCACGGAEDTQEATGSRTDLVSLTHFEANLSAADEVPANDTLSRGQALIDVSTEGELSYKLLVANIDDVVAAHIHCGAPGVNGPIGVTLFMGGPISKNGILAQGTATLPDANNRCAWLDIADVTEAMISGNTYVNVHTVVFPRGQIRGQVR
jgi:hypothetical protein